MGSNDVDLHSPRWLFMSPALTCLTKSQTGNLIYYFTEKRESVRKNTFRLSSFYLPTHQILSNATFPTPFSPNQGHHSSYSPFSLLCQYFFHSLCSYSSWFRNAFVSQCVKYFSCLCFLCQLLLYFSILFLVNILKWMVNNPCPQFATSHSLLKPL